MAFLSIISIVVGLGSLVCFIIVLTKLFPAEGVGKGILAVICGLYAFIWGWQNKDEHDLQTIMSVWTALFAVSLILNVVVSANNY